MSDIEQIKTRKCIKCNRTYVGEHAISQLFPPCMANVDGMLWSCYKCKSKLQESDVVVDGQKSGIYHYPRTRRTFLLEDSKWLEIPLGGSPQPENVSFEQFYAIEKYQKSTTCMGVWLSDGYRLWRWGMHNAIDWAVFSRIYDGWEDLPIPEMIEFEKSSSSKIEEKVTKDIDIAKLMIQMYENNGVADEDDEDSGLAVWASC